MTRNLKLYRSLNTRPARTVGLRAQLARCMVAYRYSIRILNKFWIQQLIYSLLNQNFLPSSATNDQGSKITTKTLEKIFQKDQKMLKLPPISTTKSNPGLNFSFELLISCSERKKSDFFQETIESQRPNRGLRPYSSRNQIQSCNGRIEPTSKTFIIKTCIRNILYFK